jgi:hypothetical protein
MLTKEVRSYRAGPVGMSEVMEMESDQKSVGVKPDREEVLEVTAKALRIAGSSGVTAKRRRGSRTKSRTRKCASAWGSTRSFSRSNTTNGATGAATGVAEDVDEVQHRSELKGAATGLPKTTPTTETTYHGANAKAKQERTEGRGNRAAEDDGGARE